VRARHFELEIGRNIFLQPAWWTIQATTHPLREPQS
jgi:hypothetical protein